MLSSAAAEPNSELRGQIGIQCVEPDRTLWEAELRDMQETYDPIIVEAPQLQRVNVRIGGGGSNRRRHERFDVSGLAELITSGSKSVHAKTVLKNLSELGCLVTKQVAEADLKVLLNVGSYDLSLKGQVRHVDPQAGMGIEFHEIRKGDRQILQFLLRKLSEKHFEDTLHFELQA